MIFGRQKEFEWLDKGLKLGQFFLIEGLQGVGKTHLVENWLEERKFTAKWLCFHEFASLADLLSGGGAGAELSLQKEAQNWQSVDFVVWDNLQNLSSSDLKLLWSQVFNLRPRKTHIFISNNRLNLSHHQVSQLNLRPLDQASVEKFCQHLQADLTAPEIDAVMQTTGGIPALIKLWLHCHELPQSFQEFSRDLSSNTLRVLQHMCLLIRPWDISQIRMCAGNLSEQEIAEAIQELQKRFLVKVQQNQVICEDIVRRSFLSVCSEEERRKIAEVLSRISQKMHASREFIYYSLLSGNLQLIDDSLAKLNLAEWESTSLPMITQMLAEAERIADDRKIANLHRLMLRLYFLRGDREEARKISKAIISRGVRTSESCGQQLLAECFQYCNRMGDYDFVLEQTQRIVNQISGVARSLTLIEQGVALVNGRGDSDTALKKLEAAIGYVKSNKDIDANQAKEVMGTTHFEMARIYDAKSQFQTARLNYNQAMECFVQTEKIYFSTVCLLNLSWISLKTLSWGELAQLKQKTFEQAEKFGYPYILAGVSMIEAIYSRFHLNCGKALQHIENSLMNLGTSAPPVAKFDVLGEKIRILLQMGLKSEAQKNLNVVKELVESSRILPLIERFKSLQLKIDFYKEDVDQWWQNIEDSKEFAEPTQSQLHILLLNLDSKFSFDEEALSSYPLGHLRLLERKLALLDRNDRHQFLRLFAEMELIFDHCSEPLSEKIAFYLLRAMLSDDEQNKNMFTRLARLEIARWGCDRDMKRPLELWLEAVENKKPLLANQNWSSCSEGLQARWFQWFKKISFEADSREEIIESAVAENDSAVVLEVFEDLGEVKINGEIDHHLSRSSALRKLLIHLIESSPKSMGKEQLAKAVWSEDYNPMMHDSRIYTSIQRLRSGFSDPDTIQNWNGGYKWNSKYRFRLVRKKIEERNYNHRIQIMIVRALEQMASADKAWASRSELVQITDSSDATVKRELSKLLASAKILRRGNGRSVQYSLANMSRGPELAQTR